MINYDEHNISSSDSEEASDSDVGPLDLKVRTNSHNMYLRMMDAVSISTSELFFYQGLYLEKCDIVNGEQSSLSMFDVYP